MDGDFFSQLTIVLTASLILSTIVKRLGQPSILAYIFVGCLLGPTAFAKVTSLDEFAFISEFGVVFLLFTLGLEFSLDRLVTLKRAVFVLGSVQVIVCSLVFFIALHQWGISTQASFVLAGSLAFSSTAIVSKLLTDRQELGFDYAQLAVGMLLFQDLAAILFLIITPNLADGVSNDVMMITLSQALGKGLILFLVLMAVGKWILPHIYHEVAKTHSDEIFVLSTLVIILLSSWITHYFHLSMALGGFVIGMMLGESHYRHQIEIDIKAFKDILLGLFFVSVGLQIDLTLLFDHWFRIIVSAIGLLSFKTLLIMAIGWSLGERKATALRTGLVLSQGGEFAFALISMATLSKVIPPDVSSFMLLVVIATMLISPAIISNVRSISDKIFKDQSNLSVDQLGPSKEIHGMKHHVVIGGYGRIGETVAHFLDSNNIPYVAMDTNVRLVSEQRRQGNRNLIYGDCNKIQMLKACGIDQARLVVLSFRFLSEAITTVEQIRSNYPDLPIIVRAHHENAFEELILAGANHVVPEMLEASFMVATQTLSLLGIDEQTIVEQIKEERDRRFGCNYDYTP